MYPDEPCYKRTGPSQKSANTLTATENERQQCFQALLVRNMTSDEIATFTGIDRLNTRPRCSELRKKGKIKDSGVRRPNISGKDATVWEAIRSKPKQGFLFTTERDGSSI